jgi:hypothetical protein
LGEAQIRAYGTFSHPNSLAGFMIVSLVLWTKTLPLPPPLTHLIGGQAGRGINLKRIVYWVVVFCGLVGIVLSGSQNGVVNKLAFVSFSYELRLEKLIGMF